MICLISRQPYALHATAVSEIREGIDKVLNRLFEFEVTRPVFKFSKLIPQRPQIDLETVRETLLYIESDCRDCPELERVATAIAQTISEIDRVREPDVPRGRTDVISASFLPAGL